MTFVIDANVVVKWFVDEVGSDEARVFLEPDEPLIAPAHMLGEVGEALLRSCRRGVTPPEQLDLAQIILTRGFQVVPLGEIFSKSIAISFATEISLYDSFYIATGERYDTHVVTDDRTLIRRLAGTAWSDRVRPLFALN